MFVLSILRLTRFWIKEFYCYYYYPSKTSISASPAVLAYYSTDNVVHVFQNDGQTELHETVTVYRQYRVLVDNEDTQHAESDWLAVQTTQKYIYLYTFVQKKLYAYKIHKYTIWASNDATYLKLWLHVK